MRELVHYIVHEADVAFFSAWRDGFPVYGPFERHAVLGLTDDFRAGLTIRQLRDSDGEGGAFGEWRKHAGDSLPGVDSWQVDMKLPLVAMLDDDERVPSWPDAGAPLVMVIRFLDKKTGWWRLYQFHDAILLPVDASEDSQNMMRSVNVSAGWMEERYHGEAVPDLVPAIRPVIEWRHAGKRVRAWEYDPVLDEFIEGGENVSLIDDVEQRYVSLNFSEVEGVEVAALYYMAAGTASQFVAGGLAGQQVGWGEVGVFEIGASGLNLWPGWAIENEGAVEPLACADSGRHWEHPRVVMRLLGRIYATISHGIFAFPKLEEGYPDVIIDPPLRIGRLLLLPEGGFLLPANWEEEVAP